MDKGAAAGTFVRNKFDNPWTIFFAIFMALVGYTVMVAVPVLSTALVDKAGFSEEQVGRIWGADLLGLSIGAVFAALTVAKVNRRYLILFGVVLAVAANAACMALSSYQELLMLRTIAGIGSGIFTAVAVVTLGGTTKPVIAYNLELFGFAISTALELHFLPQLTMNQIYIFFIVLAVICAVFVRLIPAHPSTKEELVEQEKHQIDHEDWHVPKILAVLCLVAILFSYINIGGYYTYIELAVLEAGLDRDWVGSVLTWSSFLAVVGCVLAYFAARFGLFKPLFISILAMAASVIMLKLTITPTSYVISIFGFMTLWTFVDIFQTAMLAHMDRTGSLVALVPSVQGFGQFVGPNIAASVIGAELGYGNVFLISGSMALVALALYMGVSLYMHRRNGVQT